MHENLIENKNDILNHSVKEWRYDFGSDKFVREIFDRSPQTPTPADKIVINSLVYRLQFTYNYDKKTIEVRRKHIRNSSILRERPRVTGVEDNIEGLEGESDCE